MWLFAWLAVFVPPEGVALVEAADPANVAGVTAPLPRTWVRVLRNEQVLARLLVEVAAKDEERARGLMYRKKLGRNEGMLLLWPTPRRVAIWMKNTYLPLDIIFIDANGQVVRVHENAKPLSTRPMPSGTPVVAVLEVPAGMAKKLGMREGVRITLPDNARR